MDLGSIFGKSWKEYWGNLGSFFKFMLIFLGIPSFIFALASMLYLLSNSDLIALMTDPLLSSELSLDAFLVSFGPYFALMGAIGIITLFLTFFVVKGIIGASLKAEKYSYSGLTNFAKERYWKFAGFAVVYMIFLVLLTILLIVPGIIFGVFWSLAAYIFLNENKSITQSLGRSKELIRGRWWRTLGYLVVIGIVGAGISFIISLVNLPFSVMSALYLDSNGTISPSLFVLNSLTGWLANFVASVFTIPFSILFFKNYYLGLTRGSRGEKQTSSKRKFK